MYSWNFINETRAIKSVFRAKGPLASLVAKGLLIFSLLLPAGCGSGYILRAAYEQSKILAAREPIESVLANPELAPNEREKLELVLAAREFAIQMGLNPKNSYTKYAAVDRDILAWVLLASKRDAFSPYTWWFPIVGTVPYKGFFTEQAAIEESQRIGPLGYESWIRGTSAFSTLGWFNDPILSTTLKSPPHELVNTVIHEITHATVWVPGHVGFNESLANFVGMQGAIEFFAARVKECAQGEANQNTVPSCQISKQYLQDAETVKQRSFELATAIAILYSELSKLYSSEIAPEEKIAKREAIFEAAVAPIREKFPRLKFLVKINNAEILQLRLYLQELDKFERLFLSVDRDWGRFIAGIKQIADEMGRNSKKDPFKLLEELDLPQ